MLEELESTSRRQASSAKAAAGELSLQMRTAFHYLEELVRQVIHANPPFTVKLDLIYLGALPAASLANGTVECTMKKLGDDEVVEAVTLAYHMTSSSKARIALNRGEAGVLKAQLERAGLKFDSREVTDAAGTVREALLIEVDIAARATLRADYRQQAVEITCENVGVLGPGEVLHPRGRVRGSGVGVRPAAVRPAEPLRRPQAARRASNEGRDRHRRAKPDSIGHEVALRLLKEGMQVVVADLYEEGFAALPACTCIRCDVADIFRGRKIVKAVRHSPHRYPR